MGIDKINRSVYNFKLNNYRKEGKRMDMQEYIKMVLVKKKMNERQLAALMEESPQNINRKIKSDMKVSFIESVANALDCDIEIKFKDKKSGDFLKISGFFS